MAESENIGGNEHFFEGVEKLLEIWFAPNPKNKNADLRKIPRLVSGSYTHSYHMCTCKICLYILKVK